MTNAYHQACGERSGFVLSVALPLASLQVRPTGTDHPLFSSRPTQSGKTSVERQAGRPLRFQADDYQSQSIDPKKKKCGSALRSSSAARNMADDMPSLNGVLNPTSLIAAASLRLSLIRRDALLNHSHNVRGLVRIFGFKVISLLLILTVYDKLFVPEIRRQPWFPRGRGGGGEGVPNLTL